MMILVGIAEGNVTEGEIENVTGRNQCVGPSITWMISIRTATIETPRRGAADEDIIHVHRQKNAIVTGNTGKVAGGHHPPMTIINEDIDDTMTTIPEREDIIQLVRLHHVAPSPQHILYQRSQPQAQGKGRVQYLHPMMIMIMIIETQSRRGDPVIAILLLLPGHLKHLQTMKL